MKKLLYSTLILFITLSNIEAAKNDQIKVNNSIHLVTVDWTPFYGSQMLRNGPISEIARKAFLKAGYDYQISFLPWNRALFIATNGTTYHGLLGAWYSEERAKDFYYSEPIYPSGLFFITKKGKKYDFSSFEKMSGLKVGVIDGYSYYPEFNNAKGLVKVKLPKPELCLNMLLLDRIDFCIDSKLVTLDLINKKLPGKLKEFEIHEPAANKQPLFITLSKRTENAKKIIAKFNKALQKMKQDGTIKRILKSHGF